MDNPFGPYLQAPAAAPAPATRPRGKRRRLREAEPQTIGTNPEIWPPPAPEPRDDVIAGPTAAQRSAPDAEGEGFTGTWTDWTTPVVGPAPRADVDWNDWATTTAADQRGDRFEMPVLPRLKDFGGGGPITRRPRKSYDDERDDNRRSRLATAAITGVLGALVLVVVVAIVASIYVGGGKTPSAAPVVAGVPNAAAALAATTTVPLPAHAVAGCEAFRDSAITISAEPGDTTTAQGAILGFEYSYYVDRDAARARTFVTDDAFVGDEAALADGIASYPPGVRYCVHITRAIASDPDLWHVTVEQQLPSTSVVRFAYAIRTTEVDPGRYRITSINYR